ncbi:hypothetical protein PIB30_068151, partial [Stylosanthes scabra]|nr:hypothetical protein [Stylosanthes scabra]
MGNIHKHLEHITKKEKAFLFLRKSRPWRCCRSNRLQKTGVCLPVATFRELPRLHDSLMRVEILEALPFLLVGEPSPQWNLRQWLWLSAMRSTSTSVGR